MKRKIVISITATVLNIIITVIFITLIIIIITMITIANTHYKSIIQEKISTHTFF